MSHRLRGVLLGRDPTLRTAELAGWACPGPRAASSCGSFLSDSGEWAIEEEGSPAGGGDPTRCPMEGSGERPMAVHGKRGPGTRWEVYRKGASSGL